ncbi:hypothetical protein GCM10009574_074460 [Streptomyces asiaticus]|uniref:Uncharacterized protein n=2 Tax=Streptomyces rhizosphaericus TaxID=114699 RepID=A0ABP4CNA9_9ACTN
MTHSNLIVARMDEKSSTEVARFSPDFDWTELPQPVGTLRRPLFMFNGLCFHLQDFASDDGASRSRPLGTIRAS